MRAAWFGAIAWVSSGCAGHEAPAGERGQREAPAIAGPATELGRGGAAVEAPVGARVTAAEPAEPPPPPAPPSRPGVSLKLAVKPTVWTKGVTPQLDLTFVNESPEAITFVSPLDGSWDGMRAPNYALELVDEAGTPVPGVLGPPLGRCGMTNALQPEQDVIKLGPRGRQKAAASPNSFTFHGQVTEVARPGKYRARVRYAWSGPEATAMSAVSDEVPVEIRGTDMALWSCWNEQQRAREDHRSVTYWPEQALGLGDGFAALVRRYEEGAARGEEVRASAAELHLIGPEGPRGSVVVAADAKAARAQAAALPGGVWVVWGLDRDEGDALMATLVREGRTPEPARVLAPAVANAYVLAVAGGGAGAGVLYLRAQGEDAAELTFQAIDAAGASAGEPVAVEPISPHTSGVRLAGDGPRGFLAAWTDREEIVVAPLDARGQARGELIRLGGKLGDPGSLWPRADGGFDLAYHKNYVLGSAPRDMMAFYLQSFDARGVVFGSRTALSRPSAESPGFGAYAAGPRGGARAYARERGASSGRRPAQLMVGPVSAEARVLSETLVGEPTIAALGDDFLVLWSDSRDDASPACAKTGECVGEAYAAIWREGQGDLLAPTRLTRGAQPKPAFASGDRWRELCSP